MGNLLNTIDESTSKIADSGKDYIRTTKEYFQLKAFQQLTILSSYFLKLIIFGSLVILALIFMAIAGAQALGKALESMALGYLCVGLLFFVLAGFIYLIRRRIDAKIIAKMGKSFFER